MQTGRMTIGVELFADHFFVEARIERAEPGEISFLLNADLALEGAASGGAAVELADEGPVRREFQPPLRAWRAPGERTELTLRYSGGAAVDVEKHGWNNGICAEMACLNFYSAYVPQELPFALAQDRLVLRRGAPWLLVKGRYDAARDEWTYGGEGFDPFNLIAYRRETMQILPGENMTVYLPSGEGREAARQMQDLYDEILRYENGRLFPHRDLPHTDAACAKPGWMPGGYLRRGLIFLGDGPLQGTEAAYTLAHETAHNWCTGAPADTWEDWLNEGTAEWAAFLFLRGRGDAAAADRILAQRRETAAGKPSLRTPDGSRVPYIHSSGAALLERAFARVGTAGMERLLRVCAELPEPKTTAAFLAALRGAGLAAAADAIESGF